MLTFRPIISVVSQKFFDLSVKPFSKALALFILCIVEYRKNLSALVTPRLLKDAVFVNLNPGLLARLE